MLLGIAVSALVLTAAWFWTSGADDQQGATPGLLVAILALVSAGILEGAALARARRSLSRRKAALMGEVSPGGPVIDLRAEPPPDPAPAPAPASGTVLT